MPENLYGARRWERIEALKKTIQYDSSGIPTKAWTEDMYIHQHVSKSKMLRILDWTYASSISALLQLHGIIDHGQEYVATRPIPDRALLTEMHVVWRRSVPEMLQQFKVEKRYELYGWLEVYRLLDRPYQNEASHEEEETPAAQEEDVPTVQEEMTQTEIFVTTLAKLQQLAVQFSETTAECLKRLVDRELVE